MYIIKNAMKNISRSLGRNILIGIIAFVIAISSTIALSIKQSAISAEEEALKNLVITASIIVDRQKLQSEAGTDRELLRELINSVGNISLEEMQKYSTSSNVGAFNYTIESSVADNDDFEAYTETEEVVEADPTTTNTKSNVEIPHVNLGGFSGIGQQGDFTIVGYNDEAGMSDFINGQSKITQGSLFNFTADNTSIISDTLAIYNEIKIGDTITITNPNLDSETYTLIVSGIYSSSSSSDDGDLKFSAAQDPANQIYTSYGTLVGLTATSEENATVSTNDDGVEVTTALRSTVGGVYSFSNIEDYESFKGELTSLGLGEYYSLNSSDVSNYENSLIPIQNLSNFANLFLVLVLGIGGVILVVLNIFNIRERKYEVGVLTAIGMKKFKVALQFMTELFMVTFLAIIFGTIAGAFLSIPTADYLLESQISAQETTQSKQEENFGRPGSGGGLGGVPGIALEKDVNYLDSINASTDISVIAQLMGIGILLTVISSLGAIVFIVRFEPLKILSNRN